MNQKNTRLEDTHIQSPCHASWEAMKGGDRARHCESCNLQVHNLAAMTRKDGESLLAERKPAERLCVRMEFHPDGRCVTTDSLTPAPKKQPKPGNWVAAALALGAGLLAACTGEKSRREPVDENANLKVDGVPAEHMIQGSIMGETSLEHPTDGSPVIDPALHQDLMMMGYVGD